MKGNRNMVTKIIKRNPVNRREYLLNKRIFQIFKFFNLFILLIILAVPSFGICQAYTPPIGIPAPDFGIEVSHLMYADSLFDFGSGPEAYKDAGSGPYTHYIDKTHPSATNTDNTFGTPDKPRLTIPKNLPAGSVVEVHNGPYNYSESIHGSTYLPIDHANGTANKPIFIRGPSNSNKFEFGGSKNVLLRYVYYVIMENVLFNGPSLKIYQPTNHFTIRHSEITGESSSGIYIWTWKTHFTMGELKENIVIYDNLIHDNGPYPATEETGIFGIMIDDATKNCWILDNKIYNNGDDGIQIIDRYWIDYIGPNADRIYIGRNEMHHDGENAIDIKGATNIIVSQNKIYGYARIMTSSWGDAIRVNDEGDQDNIWIMYNDISDSHWGIAPYNCLFPPYIIGNIIYDCDEALTTGSRDVVNNIIYNCDEGIGGGDNIVNNIVVKVSGDPISGKVKTVKNNLFWQNGKSETCTDCIEADPLFADTANYDFTIQPGSPAIDAGVAHSCYDTYYNLYGIDIKCDFNGNVRPAGGKWDIGAYEYVENTDCPQEQMNIPAQFGLQNYPNPFNPVTQIQFEIYRPAKVIMDILNIRGQKIITLIDDYYNTGTYITDWNGKNRNNLNVDSGLYFCRLIAGDQILTHKMLLVR
jgi:hypothetical protein